MTIQDLQDQIRRALGVMAHIKRELEALRALASGAYTTTLVVLGFVGFLSALLGAFAGNILFWSLK